MSIKKPTIHSMNRRSYYCDYSRLGVYHVTLKTAETLRHPLGIVVGDIDKPDDDPEAVNHGHPVVLVADNGFPKIYHPSAERIEHCATGLLLSVSPWIYSYRLKDEGITVMECKTMNCVAQALCRTRDNWWTNS